ncbi:VOC family protein [Flexivirga sp. B27]
MTLTVQPLRFTDNIDEMTRLLSALGMSVSITSDKGGWVVLAGRAGTVALHSASGATSGATQGQTTLCFEADDLDAVAHRLTEQGFGNDEHPAESMVYDEAYGRAISITVNGEEMTINGRSEDLYGYTSTGVSAGPDTGDLRVTPIRFVDDQTSDRRLLESLGFTVAGEASRYFTQLELPDAGGSVGLHYIYSDELPIVPGPFAIQLTFQTATPLPEIVRRATSVGAQAQLEKSEVGDFVTIVDPDGQQIQVHAAAQ